MGYRLLLFILCAVCFVPLKAQTQDTKIQMALDNAKAQLVEFDTERMLDSLDQEKLPKLVSGGLLANADMSNFIISRDHHMMSSYMRIGAEFGGFLDFRVSKHFSIQPQVIFTAQQNRFQVTDTTNLLWSFGMEIPVYFLGRFGNMQKGYVQFGGGLYTHFTFASNKGTYKNVDPGPTPAPSGDGYDYSRLYSLHSNHLGVCVTVGYEFPVGVQINCHYKVSLSDIAGFYTEMKGQSIADALIYPQAVSLGLGYRWK